MLRTLYKHELRQALRPLPLLLLIDLSVTAASILLEHVAALLDSVDSLLFILVTLALSLFRLVPLLTPLIIPLYLYYRFYKSLFTDEGYLTFTLPVRRYETVNVKLAVTLLLGTVGAVFSALCLLLVEWLTPDDTLYLGISVLEALWEIAREIGGFGVASLLVTVFAAFYLQTAFVYLCITLGATVLRKGKLIVAILIYYFGNSAFTLLAEILFLVISFFIGEHLVLLLENIGPAEGKILLGLLFLMLAAVLAVIGALCHLLTLHFVERKLNLP